MPPIILNTDHVEDILKDDQKGHDQRFVDELLSKEMLQLSVKDRNDIQEEIHGVKCLAVEETPELISKALKELSNEIDRHIPDSQKRAYLKSLKPIIYNNNNNNNIRRHKSNNSNINNSCSNSDTEDDPQPDTETTSSSSSSPSSDNNNNNDHNNKNDHNNNLSYIHGDDFKLRFLRCDLFDVKKAAKRLVTYLDLLVEIFGAYALKRPICLTDFSKEELRHMRKGLIQMLPYRDRSGRRIIIVFPEEEVSQIPPFVKVRIVVYFIVLCGYCIVLYWFWFCCVVHIIIYIRDRWAGIFVILRFEYSIGSDCSDKSFSTPNKTKQNKTKQNKK
jgi:hypothetical protein